MGVHTYTFPQAGVTFLCGEGTCPSHKGWPLGGCAVPAGCWGENGADIHLQPCNSSSALQQWIWRPESVESETENSSWGAWILRQSGDDEYALSCVMDNVHHCGPGDAIHLWANEQTPNQQWSAAERPREDGRSGRLKDALNSDMCVTARDSANLEMAACTHDVNQEWKLGSAGTLQSMAHPGYCITGSGYSPYNSNSTPGNIVSA